MVSRKQQVLLGTVVVSILMAYLVYWDNISSLLTTTQTTEFVNISSPLTKSDSISSLLTKSDNISSLLTKSDNISSLLTTTQMTEPVAFTKSESPASKKVVTESYFISLHPDRLDLFRKRNFMTTNSSYDKVFWFPGVDGYNQPTLDMWAKLSGRPAMNVSHFNRKKMRFRGGYREPYAVGTFLAHWHLLRTLDYRPPELRPDLYFIYEDDALCVKNVVNKTIEAVKHLPPDWDIFMIGGKVFTHYNPSKPAAPQYYNDSTKETLERDICRGILGKGDGPLAPDGSRRLSEDQPYWRTMSTLNMHAYVVNPRHVHRLLNVLQPRLDIPVDIYLSSGMGDRRLNAYMPAKDWCGIRGVENGTPRSEELPWFGYVQFMPPKYPEHVHPAFRNTSDLVWRRLVIDNCDY